MINSTTEDITMEDIDAMVTAMADNPTDSIVANQKDILTAAATETSTGSKEAGSVIPCQSVLHC
jgi:hypothetical protein